MMGNRKFLGWKLARIVLVVTLCTSLLLSESKLSSLIADDNDLQLTGCFEIGAGLVNATECGGPEINLSVDGYNLTCFCETNSKYANSAIAYLMCKGIDSSHDDGKTICNARLEIVGLKYECNKQDYDWTGIELVLAGAGVTAGSCWQAVVSRNPVDLSLCVASGVLTGISTEPCLYKICVSDPWTSVPITRYVYKSLAGDDCELPPDPPPPPAG